MRSTAAILVLGAVLTVAEARAVDWTPPTIPNPQTAAREFVSDPEGLLKPAERAELNRLLTELERTTTAEYAVVIVRSIGREAPKTFATELFNHWGIGKKGQDNGLLLLVVVGQRRWEFEVGYELEGVLPDATLSRIGATLPPYFRKGEYGAGIVAVSRAIAARLRPAAGPVPLTQEQRQRAADDQVARLARETEAAAEAAAESRRHVAYGIGAVVVVYALIALAVRGSGAQAYARRSAEQRAKDPTALSPMPSLLWALLAFAWVPPVAAVAFWLYDPSPFPKAFGDAVEGHGAFGLIGFGYAWLCLVLVQKHLRLGRAALAGGGDPYVLHQRFTAAQTGKIVGLLVCPMFFAPYLFYVWRKGKALRGQARSCGECQAPLRRLGESEDEAHLEEGQRLEEELGSIDYDAWYCDAGGHVLVLPYTGNASYSACEKCGYRTSHVAASWTVRSPTYDYSGTGAQRHECRHCGRTKETTYAIPRLVRSSTSSSSGTSRSSGSFGGGRSGGAGAGGSW